MRSRCNLILEFCNVDIDNKRSYVVPPMKDENLKDYIMKWGSYGLAYLIEALSSRGSVVNDHFLTSLENRNAFVSQIVQDFQEDASVTIEALERLLNTLDEHLEIRDPVRVYEKLHQKVFEECDTLLEEIESQKKQGFQRVRKVVITPTRKLLVVPELLMGNRFLRTLDQTGDLTLRVQFRDDDSRPLKNTKCGNYHINRTVGNALKNGITVAGRLYKYLGSSNSQMRDNGCYFFNMDGSKDVQEEIRKQFGRFDTNNIPKFMSRFGQCFTQARRSGVKLERSQYNTILDVIGGEDLQRKAYTFSDGVGNVSPSYARSLAADFEIPIGCVPSVFQVRFRGIKGILCINPFLDAVKQFVEKYELPEADPKNPVAVDISFRPSQEKFRAPRTDAIEIVKYSSPTPCSLNKPLINIMDQVTAMQNQASHRRLVARVHELFDMQIETLGRTLNEEIKARARLTELPRRIDFNYLSAENGFVLTEEPFFKSLLQCCVKYTLRKVRLKNQVMIPPSLARFAFGVIDETGLLQSGQIFFQATTNIFLKTPGANAQKMIIKGPVFITKNPQIVAGDARMFHAVNLPELHHLVDVVVFPRYGPRPHPDEMAGSDLDGDEYTVVWDQELFFDNNEKPLDFPKPVVDANPDDGKDVNTKMIDFYISYIEQDSIGTIANSFLVTSDLYGIDSEVCISIARKNSLALDFPKTGKPPEKLTRWPQGGLPAEQPDRFPDFMEKDHAPSYVSSSLNGQLYRRAKELDAVLAQSMDLQQSNDIVADKDLIVEGLVNFIDEAIQMHNSYKAALESLLDNYGIAEEAEAFSGAITNCRNRISDRDNDDMSMFNTNFVVERRFSQTFQQYRRKFFEEFGGYENCTVDESGRSNTNLPLEAPEAELNRRYCKEPTLEMKQKASAWYKACYYMANKAKRKFLSFAWIAWDVLAEIKREVHFQKMGSSAPRFTGIPLHCRLHAYIENYAHDRTNKAHFESLKTKVRDWVPYVARYMNTYQGLDELMFMLTAWAMQYDLINVDFRAYHLFSLLILHGLDRFPTRRNDPATEWLEDLTMHRKNDGQKTIKERFGGHGQILLDFFKYLGSRTFKQFRFIGLESAGSDEFLLDTMVAHLSKAAHQTYHHVTFSGHFDYLPQIKADEEPEEDTRRLHEIEPFTIELPARVLKEMGEIAAHLKEKSKVKHLVMRKLKDDYRTNTIRVIVSARGTLESLEKLRELMAIKPNMRVGGNCIIPKANLMADMVYDKIRPKSKGASEATASKFLIDRKKISEIGQARGE
ncbi:hypothetical protein L596_017953 [Steinernema carpocapsae]|uniref:RNA-dependent RNA polymerase n=1 Tax=Steinernema carpocapsae TaxID=34508 RepID=A0A4U5N3F9_STECR|nr:hypothetical protein L596_017953 [Steinernema carpocapsae]